MRTFYLGRAFAAFSSGSKEELQVLQTEFTRFKDTFDRGISVQTMTTIDKLKSQIEDLGTYVQTMVEYSSLMYRRLVRANDDDKFLEVLDTRHHTRALRCLKGTRLDLILFIFEWVQTTLNILWIYGYPGAGKSTLAMHIADLFRIAHRLGVIVEFNHNTGVTAVTLWKSIAYALAREYRECRNMIVDKIKSRSLDLANATSKEIFKQLVIAPLRQLTTSDSKISQDRLPVIIIDALDEAGGLDESSKKARKEVLDCLAEWSKLAPGIKLIITSRAEQDIELAFSDVPHKKLELPTGSLVTETSQSTQDIQLYLRWEFKNIAHGNRIEGDWPGDEIIADLARRAQGVFIWATTVLSFVDDVDPCYQLKTILDGRFPEGDVHGLYRKILDTSFPSTYDPENFVLIVGVVVVLQEPFKRTELAQLLGADLGVVNGVCKGLRTVLDDGDVIRFKHQSFVDFLTQSTSLPSDQPIACPMRFHINVSDAHDHLCKSLFRLMHKELHFNICNIPSSFMRNNELPRGHFDSAIGRPLAYACRFWSFHLPNTRSELDLDLISTFIHEDLLSWIESLSGLESLAIAAPSLVSLMQRVSSIPEQVSSYTLNQNIAHKRIQAPNLKLFMKDAIKFIRYFAPAIAQSAAHLYITALTFAPKSSLIAQLYAPRFKNIMCIDLGQLDEWPSEQAIIRGHSDTVNFVVFSPDGTRVLSCSSDKTVRVSDVETGQIVAGPSKEHTGRVLCAVYSTDGKSILSVSSDGFVQKWNADCGVDGPVDRVALSISDETDMYMGCAAFSHSHEYITFVRTRHTLAGSVVSASQSVISVLDVETGRVVSNASVEYEVDCIAFSPDDTHVACGSIFGGSFSVYNTKSDELVMGLFAQGLHGVWSISYSHGGAHIALGMGDGTIRLWDVRGSPHQVHVYGGHSELIFCVAFSSDDRWVVSGADDRTVRVWNVKTGQLVAGPFQGHAFRIQTIGFSPDSKRIASGSTDGTVCIWDVEANTTSGAIFDSQPFFTPRFALSKDTTRILSVSPDGTFQIWDTRTGLLEGEPFEVDKGEVSSVRVAYSPDNERIVCGTRDGKIRIWDVAARETVMELHSNFHSEVVRVYSVVYSNNGRYIATVLYSRDTDRRVHQIWDAETGRCIHTLQVESGPLMISPAFSADDRLIVSISRDACGFGIWNVETGDLVIESDSQTDFYVSSVTFSHDAKLVATVIQVIGSPRCSIQLWDATTAKLLPCPFDDYTSRVNCVAFSSDDKFIVSGSYDDIRVWDVKTGRTIMGPFHGHTRSVEFVSFTHDDKYIISGSYDRAFRIWSMEQTQHSLFTDQSEIDRDGWVKGANGELLFWVPLRHRANLHRPGNTGIIAPHSTQLNFGNVRWGTDWTECFTP